MRRICNEKREILLQMIDYQKITIDSLGNYNMNVVRPAFENYLNTQKKLTEEIKNNALESSKYTISENDVFTNDNLFNFDSLLSDATRNLPVIF
jgi:hypothetical protein